MRANNSIISLFASLLMGEYICVCVGGGGRGEESIYTDKNFTDLSFFLSVGGWGEERGGDQLIQVGVLLTEEPCKS